MGHRSCDLALELSSITKGFGGAQVLKGIDLAVRNGEFLSLVGMSGCGKSTLLRIIAGLESPDQGRLMIGGRDVTDVDPADRNLAMVFQSYALYPHMTVRENIATPLRMRRLRMAARLPLVGRLVPGRAAVLRDIDDAVKKAAEVLQIAPLLGRKPGQLSGGQRQRVALARALVRDPAAFLMDEPLSNLDAKLRAHMREELAALHRRLGTTFLYVTHDQVEAMTMSDRIALMEGGQIMQLGTPSELYERPANLTVARFIGTPAMNLLPAEVDGGGRIRLPGLATRLAAQGDRGALLPGPVTLGLRAEDLHLAPGGLPARVIRAEQHGADRYLTLEIPGCTRLVMRQYAGDAGIGAEASVEIGFAAERAHVFDAAGQRCITFVTEGVAA
ncbi:ABC transporter ATP-binding protein [Plastorhodobacter daqingensis]|uniref:ABC transporter ATP-binding protein n=1 Tax=Plastorhodobacter daqingensis TaxID=1387281 RepID=A0ABW2UKJ8_9RHOB